MHYFIEITDTFGGEANYSWVTRHRVSAASYRGALIKLNRDSGLSFHTTENYGDLIRADSRTGATCAFIEPWDESIHASYSVNTI